MPEIWFPNLGIQIQSLSRTAFRIFGLDIYWYAVIIVLGVCAGLAVVYLDARRTGQNPELYGDFFLYAFIACFIGARLYYVIFSWDQYRNNLWSILNIREGGLAIYGAVLAALPTAYFYTRHKGISFRKFADTAVLGLVIGQVIGRYGNLVNREAFGGYTDGLFAMRYMRHQVPYIPAAVQEHMMIIEGIEYIQVHPTFLYESLWNLGLFILLMLYRKHKKFHGELLALYLLGYGAGRLWIEGLRTDQLMLFQTGLAVSQVVSVLLMAGAVLLWLHWRKSQPLSSQEAPRE